MPRKPKYLPRFNDPSVLHEIDRSRLHQLIHPHAAFFAAHGVDLPAETAALDVNNVAVVILEPHDDTPFDLVDALTHIHEMATPEGMERLQNAASASGITLDPTVNRSPADLALQLWHDAPGLLRRQHAEHVVLKRRALESYLPLSGAPRVRPSELDGPLAEIEATVRAWYHDQGRGDGARVIVFESEQNLRLVVRHGGPYQRKGCLQDAGPGTVQFRPMEFAYVVLDWPSCELAINCNLKGERELFRRAVGACIFSQPGFFAVDRKYTLDPLRLGKVSLRCADIPGISRVRLVALTMDKGGPHARFDTITADDVLQALEDDGEQIQRSADLVVAKLLFEFSDSKKPRPVTLRSGNKATYTRDGDSELVARFMAARGFMRRDAGDAAVATA